MKPLAPIFITAFALLLTTSAPAIIAAPPLTRAFVLLDADTLAQMDETIAFIRARGGTTPITFAPRALIAHLPAGDWVGQSHIRAVITDLADVDAIEIAYGDQAGLGARAWNGMIQKSRAPKIVTPPGEDLINDALAPNDQFARAPDAPPSSYYTSVFLYGSVQVDVFLPESNGAIDPNTENWTTAMRDQVVSEVTAGINWWATTATQGGRPSANLSFNIVFHTPFNEPSIVATSYEPITRPHSDQALWIPQVMANLGYTGSYLSSVRSYNHARRTAFNRDWAYSIFIVNSLADADGKFSNGYFGYAYLGGPFVVMTYDNDGWGISRMEMVTAHETAHIFNALDEYASSGCTDTATSGYLRVANTNCENGTPPTEDSIMRSSGSQQIAYPAFLASTPIRGQIGWRDSDGDGIYDVADTTVQMSAARATSPRIGQPMAYSGSATDIPFPSPVYPAMSVNKISQVRYRINGGSWINATPSDGAFDAYTENFSFTTAALPEGDYRIEIQALNSVGNLVSYFDSFVLGSSKLVLPIVVK
jgi:hypothetical protein